MIRINLLPFRAARRRENIKQQIMFFGLIIFLCLAFMAFYYLKLNDKVNGLIEEESNLNKELAGYKKELDEIKSLEKKIAQVRTKLDVIKKLEDGKTGPVLLLSDIAGAVPKDRLWLRSLSEKKGSLSLSGTAMDNETVALFMNNLEKTDQVIEPPEPTSLDSRTIQQFRLTVMDFSIQCKIGEKEKNKDNSNSK